MVNMYNFNQGFFRNISTLNNWYLSTKKGSDTYPGTIENPVKTFSYLQTKLSPGDTVVVLDDSIIEENLVLRDGVILYAPLATLKGTIKTYLNNQVVLNYQVLTSNDQVAITNYCYTGNTMVVINNILLNGEDDDLTGTSLLLNDYDVAKIQLQVNQKVIMSSDGNLCQQLVSDVIENNIALDPDEFTITDKVEGENKHMLESSLDSSFIRISKDLGDSSPSEKVIDIEHSVQRTIKSFSLRSNQRDNAPWGIKLLAYSDKAPASVPSTDLGIKIVFDADLITDNSVNITLSGEDLDDVAFDTDHDTTMDALITALLALDEVTIATLDSSDEDNRTLIIWGPELVASTSSFTVTGGVSQSGDTIRDIISIEYSNNSLTSFTSEGIKSKFLDNEYLDFTIEAVDQVNTKYRKLVITRARKNSDRIMISGLKMNIISCQRVGESHMKINELIVGDSAKVFHILDSAIGFINADIHGVSMRDATKTTAELLTIESDAGQNSKVTIRGEELNMALSKAYNIAKGNCRINFEEITSDSDNREGTAVILLPGQPTKGGINLSGGTTVDYSTEDANTPIQITGTWVDGGSPEFVVDSDNNRLYYYGPTRIFQAVGVSDLSVDKACEVTYLLYKNGEAVTGAETPHTFTSASKKDTIAITKPCTLSSGDYIEVFTKCNDNTVTATLNSLNITLG